MLGERNLILTRFEERFISPQAIVNDNVERKVTLKDSMKTERELLKIGRSIDGSEHSVKIAKVTKEIQRMTGLVKWKDLELQTLPELVHEASRLREEFAKEKRDKDRLSSENMVWLEL